MNQILLNILTSITEQYQPELQESELGQPIKNSQCIVSVVENGTVLFRLYVFMLLLLYRSMHSRISSMGNRVVERGLN